MRPIVLLLALLVAFAPGAHAAAAADATDDAAAACRPYHLPPAVGALACCFIMVGVLECVLPRQLA